MGRDEIIGLIKLKMDESNPFEADEMVSSTLIEGVLDEAASNIALKAPLRLLPVTPITATAVKNPDDSALGHIPLPDNYLRFIRLKMDSWERPVTSLISETDPEYIIQQNKYLRGGVSRPVAAIKYHKASGKNVIEYYSLLNDAPAVKELLVVTTPLAQDLPDTLIPTLTWEAASLAFQVVGDINAAGLALQKSAEQLNLLKV